MTDRLLTPLLLSALALGAAAPAQNRPPERFVGTLLLVRSGPTDVVLNKPLVDALLQEPGVDENLREAFSDDYSGMEKLETDLPAPHLAGTFQVHVYARPRIGGDWDAAARQKARDAIVDHLRQRLDHLLYAEPRARLEQRREELRQRHAKLRLQALELQGRIDRTASDRQRSHARTDLVAQQIEEARVALLTTEQAFAQLRKLQAEHDQHMQKLQAEVLDARVKKQTLHVELILLKAQLEQAEGGGHKGMAAAVGDLENKLAMLQARLDEREQVAQQARHQLTIVLEQMPTTQVELQRQQARLDSLLSSRERHRDEQSASEERWQKAAMLRIELEHLEIDAQIARQQLVETEGRLARLEPVRYEVLTPR